MILLVIELLSMDVLGFVLFTPTEGADPPFYVVVVVSWMTKLLSCSRMTGYCSVLHSFNDGTLL